MEGRVKRTTEFYISIAYRFDYIVYCRLYLNPQILTPAVSITLSANFLLNLCWIFIWDRAFEDTNLLVLAAVVLPMIAATNIAVVALAARNLARHSHEFERGGPLFWWGVLYR